MVTYGWRPRWAWGVVWLILAGCSFQGASLEDETPEASWEITEEVEQAEGEVSQEWATATFGGGCYWCTEAVFQRLEGVEKVVSGFMGGHVPNPSYEAVCRGITGHAEVIQFRYDPAKVAFKDLLEIFWKTHDPTTLNKQGADEGTQYRSVVFYHNEEQRQLAEEYKQKLDAAGAFENPIVTEITAASEFFAAKDEHQNFYNANPYNSYCGFVIRPKIDKLKAVFADKLKPESSAEGADQP